MPRACATWTWPRPSTRCLPTCRRESSLLTNLLVRIHLIIEMILVEPTTFRFAARPHGSISGGADTMRKSLGTEKNAHDNYKTFSKVSKTAGPPAQETS